MTNSDRPAAGDATESGPGAPQKPSWHAPVVTYVETLEVFAAACTDTGAKASSPPCSGSVPNKS